MYDALKNDVTVAHKVSLMFARGVESGRIRIRWALDTNPNRPSDGTTALHTDGSISMIINLGPKDLRSVCHHETKHLFDFLLHDRRFSTRELQVRAVAHVQKMLAPPPQPKPAPPEEPRCEPSGYHALNGRRRWY
jgi:hypothetical protein